jgi:hypothetical protein
VFRRAERAGWLRGPERDSAVNGRPVGSLDDPQPGGYAGLAGGHGLAVAPTVGAFGQALAESLDLADVGLSLVGVRGDGEHGGVGGGGVQDEADRLALGVPAGQGDDPGAVGLWPGLLRLGEAVPGPLVEFGQHQVGPVDLVAGGAEVLGDRAEGDAPAGAANTLKWALSHEIRDSWSVPMDDVSPATPVRLPSGYDGRVRGREHLVTDKSHGHVSTITKFRR